MNYVSCTTPPKHWMTTNMRLIISNVKRMKTSREPWQEPTSSSDVWNLCQQKLHGQKLTTTCANQFCVKLLVLTPEHTSIWKKADSSKPELHMMLNHSSKWLMSMKLTTTPFQQKMYPLCTKWHHWLQKSHQQRFPKLKIS